MNSTNFHLEFGIGFDDNLIYVHVTNKQFCEWIMSGNLDRIFWKKYRRADDATATKYTPLINKIGSDITSEFCRLAKLIMGYSD